MLQRQLGDDQALVDTGIVVQHIDTAEGVGRAAHQALHLVLASYVAALEDRLTATAANLGGQRLARGAVKVREHHAGAGRCGSARSGDLPPVLGGVFPDVDLASNSRFRKDSSVLKLSLVDDFMHQGLLFRHHDGLRLGHARIGQAFD